MKSDRFIKYVKDTIVKDLSPETIYLFGSRARGDNRPESDYDIAVGKRKFKDADWAETSLKIQENKPTLHKIDLVRMDRASKSLIEEIRKEGILIFKNEPKRKKIRKKL